MGTTSDRLIGLEPPSRWFVSGGAQRLVARGPLRNILGRLLNRPELDSMPYRVAVSLASEIIDDAADGMSDGIDGETRFLIILDIPEPAVLRLPGLVGLYKPALRMHVTRDAGSVKRLLIAQTRSDPIEGIVDAYVVKRTLVAVLGDLSFREFPKAGIPGLLAEDAELDAFEIDPSGSFLYWPSLDLHLGPSQLLQAVDPMYLADVEIRRHARGNVALALREMRTERGITQSEIDGLSERHLRRLESEQRVRLTVDAAEKLATAFELDLRSFLRELAARTSRLRETEDVGDEAVVGSA